MRFKEFLDALGEYLKYCIKPQPTYGNKKLQKPDWYMARRQISEEVILPSDDGFTMRDKSFANIAMTNVKLKTMKYHYKFLVNYDKKKLKSKIRRSFSALF